MQSRGVNHWSVLFCTWRSNSKLLPKDIANCLEQTKLLKDSLLSLINRVSAAATKRSDTIDRRLRALETSPGVLGGGTPASASVLDGMGLTPDTLFGHVMVGGTMVTLTMNALLNQVQTLKARLQPVSKHSRNTGVGFIT